MPSNENWDNDYVECFKGQPEGRVVYPPIKASKLKPGMCGYFDVDGIWQTIVDLTNPFDAKAKKLPPVHDVSFSGGNLADMKEWGLRKSVDVEQFEITADVGVKMPGAPAGGGLSYGYRAKSDKGALLLTDGPVTYRQATPNGPLCDWIVENGKEILQRTRKPKRGVWIVTKTFSANHRRLTVLSTKGTAVAVGIDVQAAEAGEARGSSSWWREQLTELWNTDHDDEGIVLAMCGIWWKTRWYSSKAKPVEERTAQTLDGETGDLTLRPYDLKIGPFEGEEDNSEDEEDAVRVEPEKWGDVEGVEIGDEEEIEGVEED